MKDVKPRTDFSEKAFLIFDGMYKGFLKENKIQEIENAKLKVCNIFGYEDITNFFNAYTSWDVYENW